MNPGVYGESAMAKRDEIPGILMDTEKNVTNVLIKNTVPNKQKRPRL